MAKLAGAASFELATPVPQPAPFDHGRVSALLGWTPHRSPREIIGDTVTWIRANEEALSQWIV